MHRLPYNLTTTDFLIILIIKGRESEKSLESTEI